MTDDLYYIKLESTSTSDLVDMLREKDRRIAGLEKENGQLEEELSKRILEQQKTIGSLTDTIDELKEQCSILADCNTCHSTCKNENIEMKKQLTKAKELIEELSSSLSVVGECGEEECELLNRAEQFIKE